MRTTDSSLTPRECQELLRSATVGRLLFTEHALPALRPVEFTTVDDEIIMHSPSGSWAEKLDRAVVAFETDEINSTTHTGWSVVVVGRARVFEEPAGAPARSRRRYLALPIERISGQRVFLAPLNGVAQPV